MKVITLGGGFIADHLPYPKVLDRITPHDMDGLDYALSRERPDVIVNCIGRTGRPNVDWCETHQAETYQANMMLPLEIADWCQSRGVQLIQLGSGCIYFGESPNVHYLQGNGMPFPDYGFGSGVIILPSIKVDDGWVETDFANPQSFYSKTKYACDLAIGNMDHVATLRIRMPISHKDTSRNLINKLKGYKQIINIPNSVTFMTDLVGCVDWVIATHQTGIFHVANPGPLTAVDIMREYQKYSPEHEFDIITEHQLDKLVLAKRSNCILNTDKLTNAGFTMTPAKQALQQCMANYFGRQHA